MNDSCKKSSVKCKEIHKLKKNRINRKFFLRNSYLPLIYMNNSLKNLQSTLADENRTQKFHTSNVHKENSNKYI